MFIYSLIYIFIYYVLSIRRIKVSCKCSLESRMETSRVPSTSAGPRSSVIRSRVPVLKGVTSNYWEDHGIMVNIWLIYG